MSVHKQTYALPCPSSSLSVGQASILAGSNLQRALLHFVGEEHSCILRVEEDANASISERSYVFVSFSSPVGRNKQLNIWRATNAGDHPWILVKNDHFCNISALCSTKPHQGMSVYLLALKRKLCTTQHKQPFNCSIGAAAAGEQIQNANLTFWRLQKNKSEHLCDT